MNMTAQHACTNDNTVLLRYVRQKWSACIRKQCPRLLHHSFCTRPHHIERCNSVHCICSVACKCHSKCANCCCHILQPYAHKLQKKLALTKGCTAVLLNVLADIPKCTSCIAIWDSCAYRSTSSTSSRLLVVVVNISSRTIMYYKVIYR